MSPASASPRASAVHRSIEMHFLRKFRSFTWVCLLTGLSACAHETAIHRPSTEVPVALLAPQGGVPGYRAQFKARLDQNGEVSHLTGSLAIQQPGRLRLEVASVIGPPLVYGWLLQDQARLYLPYSNKTFLTTDDATGWFRQRSNNLLTLNEILSLMAGGIPACKGAPALEESSTGPLRVRCEREGRPTLSLFVDARSSALTGLGEPGSLQPAVTLLNAAPLGSSRVPTVLQLQLTGLALRLELSEVEPLETQPDAFFQADAPAGATVLPLEGR